MTSLARPTNENKGSGPSIESDHHYSSYCHPPYHYPIHTQASNRTTNSKPSPKPSTSPNSKDYCNTNDQCATKSLLQSVLTTTTHPSDHSGGDRDSGENTTKFPINSQKHGHRRYHTKPSESNIVNLSSSALTPNHISFLNLGLSFTPSHLVTFPKLNRDFTYFSDTLISRLLPFSTETNFILFIRNQQHLFFIWMPPNFLFLSSISTTLSKPSAPLNVFFPKSNLSSVQRQACKEVSTLPNTIIIKANKGDSIVVLDTQQYLSLAYNHLNDHTTYMYLKLQSDLTLEVAQNLHSCLSMLYAAGFIDSITFDFLKHSDKLRTQ